MGEGGYITMVNGTKYDWIKSFQHSYQMNSWNFPDVIQAGQNATIYVEWDQGFFHTVSDDAGEAGYTLRNTNLSFQVQARAKNRFDLKIAFTNLETQGNPNGTVIDLGWQHDGYVNFILCGEQGDFTSTNLPTSWMQNNLDILGNKNLRQICIPGSHDSGMSQRTGGTAFACDGNTLTQSRSIGDQLKLGVRWFDIRPIISAGKYSTGHYSYIDQINSWQGANGQSIDSIIDDINAYCANNKECKLSVNHSLKSNKKSSNIIKTQQIDLLRGLF